MTISNSIDIFISYARADNEFGWVTLLLSTLKSLFRTFNGDFEPRFYFDEHSLLGNEPLDETLKKSLRSSGVLLVVMSRNWCNSVSCLSELNCFIDATGGIDKARCRIFVIQPSTHDVSGWPTSLQQNVGKKFYELNETTGHEETISLDHQKSGRPHSACIKLAKELWQCVEQQKRLNASRANSAFSNIKHEASSSSQSDPRGCVHQTASNYFAGGIYRDLPYEEWCPELVVVPSGSFIMGSSESDPDAYPEEKPQHRVEFQRQFAMGRYLVTFDEFDFYCEITGREKPRDEGWGRGRRPVINVSWEDAVQYVQWLACRTGKPYRLPSESEWEYACRGGTTSRFYSGNELTAKHANFNCNIGRTTTVGAFPANPWGLYDMIGNVWEHVQDPYHSDYHLAPCDGSVWDEGGNQQRRVVRGGSFSYSSKDNRSAVRCDHQFDLPDVQHGFRVACSL